MKEEMENKKENLQIFENCASIDYVIIGFTGQDLAFTGVTILVGLIIGFIIVQTTGNTIPGVFMAILISSAGVIFFRKDRYMENCIDKIRIIFQYLKSQKKYEYEYVNIYENIKEKIED